MKIKKEIVAFIIFMIAFSLMVVLPKSIVIGIPLIIIAALSAGYMLKT